ncbi:MAG: ADP-forming succinate--CoA ligase subunit beta [Pseudomonadota bacterium]|mgnify:FL=1
MNIHEYQAKELLRKYGVPVPPGSLAHSVEQAVAAAEELGGGRFVIKAQIHAGGRGKAGGVKIVHSLEEVSATTDGLIGRRLVTAQTGPEGRLVQRVLVEQAADIAREFYFGLVIDRVSQRITAIACDGGGVNIEETARNEPKRIVREAVDPAVGMLDFQCRKVATHLGLGDKQLSAAVKLMRALYRCFRDNDALLIEINPLALTREGRLLAVDAKMEFDGNALYRQPQMNDLRDFDEEDPKEVEAAAHGLNYIALDGNIGCIVNGAGLAMATMDAIALHGGRPANFLDVGGGASPEKVANAFRIVLSDRNVKAVLINIFAGINRCEWIAEGVVRAMRELKITQPVVVRLAGTNVEQGRAVLAQSGLKFLTASQLDDAAMKAVQVVNGAQP